MNRFVGAGLAAAAVVVVAFLGIRLLLPGQNLGTGGPAPSPTVVPTASPLATPVDGVRPIGDLEPGEYDIMQQPADPVRVTLTVPEGWTGGEFVIWKYEGAAPEGMAVAAWLVENVYTDRCQWVGAELDPPVGPTVDELVDAFVELPAYGATAPVDITVDGFAGHQVEMVVPSDIDLATCDGGEFRSWSDPQGGARFQEAGEISRNWILDVDGTRILIFGRWFADTSAQDREELFAIMDSIQIKP